MFRANPQSDRAWTQLRLSAVGLHDGAPAGAMRLAPSMHLGAAFVQLCRHLIGR
jgi:hypothetical protein